MFHASAWKASDKNLADCSQTKETQRGFVAFGSLAIFHCSRGPDNASGPLLILDRASSMLRKIKTHGFASPVFTGFAFVGFLQGYISTRFHNRALQATFKMIFAKQRVHALCMDRDTNETNNGRKLDRSASWIMFLLIDQTLRDFTPWNG
jgi:hypothetical protein